MAGEEGRASWLLCGCHIGPTARTRGCKSSMMTKAVLPSALLAMSTVHAYIMQCPLYSSHVLCVTVLASSQLFVRYYT